MTYYLDTSLMVAALTPESHTDRAQHWLETNISETLTISEWVVTEFSSALAMKVRMHVLTLDERAQALSLFAQMVAGLFHVEEVKSTDFRIAAAFANDYESGLRASDALHLAIASERGATLVTL